MKPFKSLVRVGGHFKFEGVCAITGRVRRIAEIDNLILDAGLERIGTAGFLTHCMVGSGSAAPLAGQTTLAAQIANTSNQFGSTVYNVNLGGGYAYLQRSWQFGVGAAAGNLSEVGVGWSSTQCFSRALIVDSGGSPTTITVLSTEYLRVTYEFRVYWPSADTTGTVTLGGTGYAWTARPANVGSWGSVCLQPLALNGAAASPSSISSPDTYGSGSTLGANTANPTGASLSGATPSLGGAYSSGSRQQVYNVTWATTFGSAIQALRLYTSLGIWQVHFTTAIPKTTLNELSLNFTCSWARKSI